MQGSKRSLFLGQAQFEETAQPPDVGMGLHKVPPGMSRLQAGGGQPQANALDVGGPGEPGSLRVGGDRRVLFVRDVAAKHQLLGRHLFLR